MLLKYKCQRPESMKNPSRKGDEYAVIQIHVPKHLTPAAKQKLTEYAKAAS